MQNDPMRQRMLMKTELRVKIADSAQGHLLEQEVNGAIKELINENFSVTQVQPMGDKILIIGQKVTLPLPEAGAVAGTQQLEVSYNYVEKGDMKTLKFPTLMAAVKLAGDHSSQSGMQPISIHVSSITSYGLADILAMKGQMP